MWYLIGLDIHMTRRTEGWVFREFKSYLLRKPRDFSFHWYEKKSIWAYAENKHIFRILIFVEWENQFNYITEILAAHTCTISVPLVNKSLKYLQMSHVHTILCQLLFGHNRVPLASRLCSFAYFTSPTC